MDRFYPVGLPSKKEYWKTTYEVMNEMRVFERSAYPPGTSIHLPGISQSFGYSNPGPEVCVLSQPDLALSKLGSPRPRENHARTKIQVADDRVTFEQFDTPDMLRNYNSPTASAVNFHNVNSPLVPAKSMRTTRVKSLPALTARVPPRLNKGLVKQVGEPFALPAPVLRVSARNWLYA